jgi:Zn-dependent protease with chaperone function
MTQGSEALAPSSAAQAGERPLSPGRAAAVVGQATLTLAAFYVYAVAALLGMGLLMLAGVAVAVGAARFGMARAVMAPVRRLGVVGGAMLRSLGLKRSADFEMPLQRAEAPGLFEVVERTAARLGAKPPERIVLTVGANAFVRFGGIVRERGRTTLGFGYDLLAGLPRSHAVAVVAHEMAHARLIQRGFQGWLFRGNARIHQLAGTLRGLGGEPHREGGSGAARMLAGVPTRLGRACNRLVATYSRQHEFAADRLAAEVSGGRTAAAALLETHVLAAGAAAVEWRDRVVRVERGGSFAEWLRARLLPATEEDRTRVERRVMMERETEESTHPALADRIAALPRSGRAPQADEPPALSLLADADATAVLLVRHMEALAEAEGRRESERLRRHMRKKVRGRGTGLERAGRITLILGVGFLFVGAVVAVLADSPTGALRTEEFFALPGLLTTAAGYALKRRFRWRERFPVPMPPAARILAALEVPQAERMPGEWSTEVEARLRASLPQRARRWRWRRAGHWARECYAALEACDFRTAYVAGRLCLRDSAGRAEGQVGFGLAGAYLTGGGIGTLDGAVAVAGPGASLSWTTGWAFAMLGENPLAEVYLLDAVEHHPDRATPAALLARVQGLLGKPREAERAGRAAIAAEPAEPLHREFLVDLLIGAGRARSAREELTALQALRPGNEGDDMRALHVHVMLGEDDEALVRADEVAARTPGSATAFRVAQALHDGESGVLRAAAERWYAGPAEDGFRAAAMLGLASLALRGGDRSLARRRVLAGMDLTHAGAPDAPRAADLFPSFCRGLQAVGEEERCGAWWVTVSLPGAPEGLRRLKVLVCHADQAQAVGLADEVRAALDPSARALDAPAVEPAGQDDTPTAPVVPGIYRYLFTADA